MKSYRLFVRIILAFAVAITGSLASAENSQTLGDYVVHHNAFTTDVLEPEVAKEYNIRRSKNRGMINIVVLKKVMGTTGEPVTATINGTATNLNGQLKTLKIREVHKGKAIYYLAEFGVSHKETLDFNLQVKPAGMKAAHTVKFRQQFYTR